MSTPCHYRFGGFVIDADNRLLHHCGELIPLAPKIFDTLLYLVEHPQQIVSKQELIDAVWRETVIEAGGVARNISILRTILDKNGENRYIETVPKRGYRLNINVSDDHLAADPSLGNASPASVNVSRAQKNNQQSTRRKFWQNKQLSINHSIAMAGLVFAVAVASAFMTPYQRSSTYYKLKQLTYNSPDLPVFGAAVSPDGKRVAYTEARNLIITTIGSMEQRQIASPSDLVPSNLEWFPDNTHLLVTGFNARTLKITAWKVSTVTLEFSFIQASADNIVLSQDGKHIAFIRDNSELWIADSNGDRAALIASAPASSRFHWLSQFSHDSKHVFISRTNYINSHTLIESLRTDNGEATVLFDTDHNVTGFYVANDTLFISEKTQHGCRISAIALNSGNGKQSNARTLATLVEGYLYQLRASKDGQRVTAILDKSQSDVYVGDLQEKGTTLSNIKRLTMDDSNDVPIGWWKDNDTVLFHSNRRNNFGIYYQPREQSYAETLVTNVQNNTEAAITANHRWLLYFSFTTDNNAFGLHRRLTRKPIEGGAIEVIDAKPDLDGAIHCAATVDFCVVAAHDANETVYYQLDAETGETHELARTIWSPRYALYGWDVSPDGARIAYIDFTNKTDRITIITLGTRPVVNYLNLPENRQLSALSWDATGKGFFVSSHESGSHAVPLQMFHLFLNGQIDLLRYQPNGDDARMVSSPDGQHLAFQQWTADSNAWMMER